MKINREKLVRDLKDIRRDATMDSAEFGLLNPERFDYPRREADVTPFIRERTRIWRDTWIVGMLDEMIKDLENGTSRYAP